MSDTVEILELSVKNRAVPGFDERVVAVTGLLRLPTRDHAAANETILQAQTLLALTYGPGTWAAQRHDDLLHLSFRWEIA